MAIKIKEALFKEMRNEQAPFRFKITNNTDKAIKDVSFLEAGKNIVSFDKSFGIKNGISVSYEINGITYENLLYTLLCHDFEICGSYISSDLNIETIKNIKMECINIRGEKDEFKFNAKIPKNQHQTTIIFMGYLLKLNQFLKLTIGKIEPNQSVYIDMYEFKKRQI